MNTGGHFVLTISPGLPPHGSRDQKDFSCLPFCLLFISPLFWSGTNSAASAANNSGSVCPPPQCQLRPWPGNPASRAAGDKFTLTSRSAQHTVIKQHRENNTKYDLSVDQWITYSTVCTRSSEQRRNVRGNVANTNKLMNFPELWVSTLDQHKNLFYCELEKSEGQTSLQRQCKGVLESGGSQCHVSIS